ncbi:nitrous oxide reductase accessory protein NosL [Chloracidobacterium validum]|uniref:Nitrous oxide reductase accessory protein NosL n=1 Tax=Chloracidobacterium validum TaxID=2821543 RepID=A0ABX8BDL3_9BACT|nr:nitrous oxide reductase accessory protein NosL [Chloracidobacterium validum]QUW03749.1 nitrous oxide reductase accessory protein NosL [Chloracidobacterium validum]
MTHHAVEAKTRRQVLQSLLGLVGIAGVGCQNRPQSAPAAVEQRPPKTSQPPEVPSCPICGMPVLAEESENRFEATVPNQPPVQLCSALCAVVYTDRRPEVTRLDVVDYQHRTLVPAMTAFHLYASKLDVRAAMPPLTAAFAVRADAEAIYKRHGGRILTWDELRRAIRQTDNYKTSP